ncbi:MAG: VCBS repeat-containing protein, partial [Bacteroidetes bacterium]|nr:VCBS repeat-containing protein [Bacteroidota bacterium]
MKAILLAVLAFLLFCVTVVAQDTIPGLNHPVTWSGTAQGILPSIVGQTAVDAAYGQTVVGLGDINNDGYDDVAVGMPGLADVISGSGSLSSVGAVMVYLGSASGISSTPAYKLQPSTAVAGALFGYSIAVGDVTGDGRNDIIVGAPLDQVSISIGGGNTATGTVGKVYVFSGTSLSAATTTPLLTLS